MGLGDLTGRQGAILAGALVGGYTSDVQDNFVGGIPALMIGGYVGSTLKLPNSQFLNNPLSINLGPTIRDELIQESADNHIAEQVNQKNIDRTDKLFSREAKAAAFKANYNNKILNTYNDRDVDIQYEIKRRQKDIDYLNKQHDSIIQSVQTKNKLDTTALSDTLVSFENKAFNGMYKARQNRVNREIEGHISQDNNLKQRIEQYINNEMKGRPHLKPNDTKTRNILLAEFAKKDSKLNGIIASSNARGLREFNNWVDDQKRDNKVISELAIQYNSKLTRESEEALIDKINANRNKLIGVAEEGSQNLSNYIHQSYYNTAMSSLEKQKQRFEIADRIVASSKDKISKISDILRNSGYNVEDDSRESVMSAMKRAEGEQLHKHITGILNSEYSNTTTDLNKTKVDKLKNKVGVFASDDTEGLSKWFSEQMGHSVEDADRKAAMFIKRAEAGSSITIGNGNLTFKDKISGDDINMPLTSYTKKGDRFHYAGKGNYNTVTQFNPYGLAYKEGIEIDINGERRTVTAKDMMRGYDPEEMLRFLPEDTDISEHMSRIQGLFHYNSQDAGSSEVHLGSEFDASSPKFKNHQGMVSFEHALNYKSSNGTLNKEYPMRKVQAGAMVENETPERVSIYAKMAEETQDPNLMNGVSNNALYDYNTKGKSILGFAAPAERNPSGVGNRDNLIANKNNLTENLETLLGTENFNSQFSSSQAMLKIDVRDHKTFNNLATAELGDQHTFFDGAAFYNRGYGEDYITRDNVTLQLNKGKDTTIFNEDLQKALSQTDMPLGEYLEKNPIHIGTDSLAINGEFNVGLKNHFTGGYITGATESAGNILLKTEAYFEPNTENNFKLFSSSSKLLTTGVDTDSMKYMQQLGTDLNTGAISYNKETGVYKFNGEQKSTEELRDIVRERSKQLSDEDLVHIISAAEDTGADKIHKAMTDGLKGNQAFDQLVGEGHSTAMAGFVSSLFNENKASVDINATALTYMNGYAHLLNRDRYIAGSDKYKSAVNSKIAENLSSTGIIEDYLKGGSVTIGSINYGKSIVGAGNRAGMSWVAMNSLLQSGFTKEDLSVYGQANEELLYEVKSHVTEQYKAKISVNEAIAGRESDFLQSMATHTDPSKRIELLEQYYGKEAFKDVRNSNYISYNLHNKAEGLSSINFSKINTNRSGFFNTEDGIGMLKDLDKRKIELVEADLDLKHATDKNRKQKQAAYDRAVKHYQDSVKVAYSGSNNLLKKSIGLTSESSSIMQVKAIGGESGRYADDMMQGKVKGVPGKQESRQVWFASKEELQRRAKQAGLELEFRGMQGYKGVHQAMVKAEDGNWIPFSSLNTREPAQGPLSSDLIIWATSTDLKDTVVVNKKSDTLHNAYTSVNNKMYIVGSSGDGDQDTLQTLTAKFKTLAQYNEHQAKRTEVREAFLEVLPVLKQMSPKSNKASVIRSITNIDKAEDAAYNMAGAIKGRNRKTLAAKATELATHFNQALTMSMDTSNPQEAKEILKARMMVYQVVENLLKSSHMETERFLGITQQPVERMIALRNQYIGKVTDRATAGKYRSTLMEELPKFLNLSGIMKEGTAEQKQQAQDLLHRVVDAEVEHSISLKDVAYSPLDIAESRLKDPYHQFLGNVADIVEHNSVVGSDLGDYETDVGKAAKQTYNASKSYLTDVLRNNKMKIGGGLAAMGAVALMTRDQPDFEKPPREYSSNMMRAPSHPIRDVVMGMETNPNKAAYMTPKSFNGKNVHTKFQPNEDENPFTDMMEDPEGTTNQLLSSMFNNGIRTARLIN